MVVNQEYFMTRIFGKPTLYCLPKLRRDQNAVGRPRGTVDDFHPYGTSVAMAEPDNQVLNPFPLDEVEDSAQERIPVQWSS